MGLDYISDAGSPDSAIQSFFFIQIDARVSDVWLTQSNDDDNVNSTLH